MHRKRPAAFTEADENVQALERRAKTGDTTVIPRLVQELIRIGQIERAAQWSETGEIITKEQHATFKKIHAIDNDLAAIYLADPDAGERTGHLSLDRLVFETSFEAKDQQGGDEEGFEAKVVFSDDEIKYLDKELHRMSPKEHLTAEEMEKILGHAGAVVEQSRGGGIYVTYYKTEVELDHAWEAREREYERKHADDESDEDEEPEESRRGGANVVEAMRTLDFQLLVAADDKTATPYGVLTKHGPLFRKSRDELKRELAFIFRDRKLPVRLVEPARLYNGPLKEHRSTGRSIRSMLEDLNRLTEADEDLQTLVRDVKASPDDANLRKRAIQAFTRVHGEDAAGLGPMLGPYEAPLIKNFKERTQMVRRIFDDHDDFYRSGSGAAQPHGAAVDRVLKDMEARVKHEGGVEIARNKELDQHADHPGVARRPDTEKGFTESVLYRGPYGYFYTMVNYVSPPPRPVLGAAHIFFRSNWDNFPSYVK